MDDFCLPDDWPKDNAASNVCARLPKNLQRMRGRLMNDRDQMLKQRREDQRQYLRELAHKNLEIRVQSALATWRISHDRTTR